MIERCPVPDNGTCQNEDLIELLRAHVEALETALREIRDEARSRLPSDVLGLSDTSRFRHKLDRIAAEANAALAVGTDTE